MVAVPSSIVQIGRIVIETDGNQIFSWIKIQYTDIAKEKCILGFAPSVHIAMNSRRVAL